MFVFAIMSAKPQLQVIKRVVNDCALSLIQDGEDFVDDVNVVQVSTMLCDVMHPYLQDFVV